MILTRRNSREVYEKAILEINDLLRNEPALIEIELLQEWLAEVRIKSVVLSRLYGQIKAHYAEFYLETLKALSAEDYKKYCKSEGATELYVNGLFPLYDILEELKLICIKYLPQVSPETMTLVSAHKKAFN